MPNIEMFGMGDGDIEVIHRLVERGLSEKELDDVVLTDHEADVSYIDQNPAPFIRVTDTNKERAERIAGLFLKDIDVEIMILHKFIPALTQRRVSH
ncbi:MAG: hypothetical protein PHO90_01235 [Candidatus Pacebacteria bacterium]|nr:hypothetical protein [Candidatus Paceibacterota bacterium]